MIKLNDKYKIRFDSMNYILIETNKKSVWKWDDKKEKNFKIYGETHGNEVETTVGSYGTVLALLASLMEHECKCKGGELESLESLVILMTVFKKDVMDAIKFEIDMQRREKNVK